MIVVAGSMNYNINLRVKRMPRNGEVVTAEEASASAGGRGANQAIQAAGLGARIFMIGAVGNDSMGNFLLSHARNKRLDISHVKRSEYPITTGISCTYLIEDGRILTTINRGANYDINFKDIDNAEDLFSRSRVLIIQNEIPYRINLYAIEKARRYGLKVIYNAAPVMPESEDVLLRSDVIVVSDDEASSYLGTEIHGIGDAVVEGLKISSMMGNVWIISSTGQGAVVCSKGRSDIIRPDYKEFDDGISAEDSFTGGLACGFLKNESVFGAARFAEKCFRG